eukprot:3484040-Prymnesium_polylepis.1
MAALAASALLAAPAPIAPAMHSAEAAHARVNEGDVERSAHAAVATADSRLLRQHEALTRTTTLADNDPCTTALEMHRRGSALQPSAHSRERSRLSCSSAAITAEPRR